MTAVNLSTGDGKRRSYRHVLHARLNELPETGFQFGRSAVFQREGDLRFVFGVVSGSVPGLVSSGLRTVPGPGSSWCPPHGDCDPPYHSGASGALSSVSGTVQEAPETIVNRRRERTSVRGCAPRWPVANRTFGLKLQMCHPSYLHGSWRGSRRRARTETTKVNAAGTITPDSTG